MWLPPTLAALSLLTQNAGSQTLSDVITTDSYNSVFSNEISDASGNDGARLLEAVRLAAGGVYYVPAASPNGAVLETGASCGTFAKPTGAEALVAQALPVAGADGAVAVAQAPQKPGFFQRFFASKAWRHVRHFCVQVGPVLSVICMLLPLLLLLL